MRVIYGNYAGITGGNFVYNHTMKYTTLGQTDMKISTICLGTMNWGEQNTEKEARAQLDYAIEKGVNFLDTAEVYPIPPRAETGNKTEEFIGRWLNMRKNRNKLIIASKVVGPREGGEYLRGGKHNPRLDAANIKFAIKGSLKRLQTDHIDLYQVHWPSRPTNYFGVRGYNWDGKDEAVAIEETLGALTDLVKEGLVRAVGVSNETPWGVHEYVRLHEQKNMAKIQSIQNPYSLIMREFEAGLAEMCLREQIGLLVYSPLAMGVLTGKYLGGKMPKGSRFDYSNRNIVRYNPPHAQEAIEAYVSLAREHNITPAQLAIAFTLTRPFVAASIIGATSVAQVEEDISAVDVELGRDVMEEIEKIHTRLPNPIA